jgi:hypothetical protein
MEVDVRGRRAQCLTTVLGFILLSGCGEAPWPAAPMTSVVSPQPQEANIPPVAPAAPPRKPGFFATENPGTQTELGTEGVDRLIGLGEDQIEAALGPPMLQEDRAPTKLWVFRDHACTISVTLYPDVETRKYHALAYEVISDVHTAERTRQCIAEFAARFPER